MPKREEVRITTPFIKLDSLLKFGGAVETGGQAKELIQGGKVLVNGELCLMRGKKVYPGDRVTMGETEYLVTKP